MGAPSRSLVSFVRGPDPTLVSDAVRSLLDHLVGEADRSLMVDEIAGDDFELREVVDAAQTPPFLTDHRVVVARNMERFTTTDSIEPLLGYLAVPLASTSLVLVWSAGGRVPKKLTDAVTAAGGEIIDTKVAAGKGRRVWLDDQLAQADVVLDRASAVLLADRLGEDVSRLGGILSALSSSYGPGSHIGVDQLEPFLGQGGDVPPWDLTDAIDRGDIAGALALLHRMQRAGDRHGLAIMASLHNHFGRMLRLDGASARSDKEAASILGLKGSTFPAKKALNQSRRLGSDKITRAIGLLADADLALRGTIAWPQDLVMEVLVARLASLSR